MRYSINYISNNTGKIVKLAEVEDKTDAFAVAAVLALNKPSVANVRIELVENRTKEVMMTLKK